MLISCDFWDCWNASGHKFVSCKKRYSNYWTFLCTTDCWAIYQLTWQTGRLLGGWPYVIAWAMTQSSIAARNSQLSITIYSGTAFNGSVQHVTWTTLICQNAFYTSLYGRKYLKKSRSAENAARKTHRWCNNHNKLNPCVQWCKLLLCIFTSSLNLILSK